MTTTDNCAFAPSRRGGAAATRFELQFFWRGRGNARALELFEVEGGASRPIDVPAGWFRADGGAGRAVPGAAGWRMHYPLNGEAYRDELITFLGASYFRALGAGLRYGLSARALVVDASGGRGEEFPAFTRFWFERPAPGARVAVVHALLDGRAWRACRRDPPGASTQVDAGAVDPRAPVVAGPHP
jgi:glucans biosynthesis protein